MADLEATVEVPEAMAVPGAMAVQVADVDLVLVVNAHLDHAVVTAERLRRLAPMHLRQQALVATESKSMPGLQNVKCLINARF